jgi:hypothetical protein
MKHTERNEVVFVGDDLAFVQLEHLRVFEADGLDEQLVGFYKRMDAEVVIVFQLKRQGNELVKRERVALDFADDKSTGYVFEGVFALVEFFQDTVFVLGLTEEVAVLRFLGLHFDDQKSSENINVFEQEVLNIVVVDHFLITENFIKRL